MNWARWDWSFDLKERRIGVVGSGRLSFYFFFKTSVALEGEGGDGGWADSST